MSTQTAWELLPGMSPWVHALAQPVGGVVGGGVTTPPPGVNGAKRWMKTHCDWLSPLHDGEA